MSSPTSGPGSGGGTGGPVVSVRPAENVYTALLVAGLASVLVAWIFLLVRLFDWYGVRFVEF